MGRLRTRGAKAKPRVRAKQKLKNKAPRGKSSTRGRAQVKTKGGKSLMKRSASAAWKSTKKLGKFIGKTIGKIAQGAMIGLGFLADKLFGDNQEAQEQELQQAGQNAENAVMPEIENSKESGRDKDSSGESQLGLSKDQAALNAGAKTKSAQASKTALGTYNKAQSAVSTALNDLETSGIVATEFKDSIPEVVEQKEKVSKLPPKVADEVKKSGGLGVVGLQTLFGKIDGVKESVIQVGKMLYAAQDIQIKQNNEHIKHLAEIQRILKDQGNIDAAATEADITEKQVNVEKDKIEADTARKSKSAADKAYEEATNANAEAQAEDTKLREQLSNDRIARVRGRIAKAVKPKSRAAKFGIALGAAALLGYAKKLFDGNDDKDLEDDEEDENIYTDEEGNEYERTSDGKFLDADGNEVEMEGPTEESDNDIELEDGTVMHRNQDGTFSDEHGDIYTYDPKTEEFSFKEYNPNTLVGTAQNFLNDHGDDIYYGGLGLSMGQGAWDCYNLWKNWDNTKPWWQQTGKKAEQTVAREGAEIATHQGSKALEKLGVHTTEQELARATMSVADRNALKAEADLLSQDLASIALKRKGGQFASEEAAKLATKKAFGKFAGKAAVKKIPFVGLGLSAYFAKDMWDEGDYLGAGLEVLSGVASCVPVVGTVVSGLLDGIQFLWQMSKGGPTISDLEAQRSYVAANSPGWENWINEHPGQLPPIEAYAGVADTTHPRNVTPDLYRQQQMMRDPSYQRMQERARNKSHWDEELRLEAAAPRIPGQPPVRLYNDIPDWYRAEHEAELDRIINDRPQFRAAPRYAEGGIVPGNPADGDSVPAMLQPGEFVMPVDLVQRLSSALEAGGTDASDGPVRGSKPVTPRQVTVHHPTIPTTRRTMLRPSEQPAQVPQTSINPKDFENAVHNENFDIVSAVGAISELPSYDLAEGEDSNKTKDPTEASIQGICARYVRSALEAGGINAQSHPGEAYEYAKWLPKQGFNVIDNNSMLLPGDISVEGKTDMNPHGHIAMWNGVQWVSDRLQNSRLVTPPGMHGELTLLRHHSMPETKVSENTDYGKADFDYGADNNVGASLFDMRGMLSGMPANYQSLIASSPANQKAFVQNIRSMLIKSMETKRFVKPEDAKLYADVMTAQVAQETGWGQHIPAGGRSNNWSGMTRGTAILHGRGGTGMIHSSGTGDYNDYAVFDSIDDWADEYVEYLHRKWKAFDRGPENFLNQLEYSTINPGQRYGGRTPDAYISAVTGCLPRVRAIAYENGEVASLGPGSGSQVGVNWWTNFMNSYNGLRYGTGLQGETPGFNGEYGPRGLWKPITSNPDDGRYSPNRGSQDKQVSVGPPNNFPTRGTVTLDYRIQGNEQGNGGQGTYGQLFVNGKYFSDAHRTLANGAQYNVGRTVPIWWNPSGKIIGTRASSDNWRSYRDNYIREKYGDQAVRQGRMPGMNEGSGTGGNRIHAGADSSWSEGCLVVGYDDKNGTHKMNTTDSYATWWSLYQGLDTLDKQGGRAQLKMTDMRGGGNAPLRNEPAQPWRATWGDAGDEPKDTVVKTSDIPENEATEATVASPIANMMPRATANFDRTQFSSPHLPIPEMPEEPEGSEVTKKEKESPQVTTPIIYAPQTHNQGGNTTVNNHTEVHNHIHTDSAADAELR